MLMSAPVLARSLSMALRAVSLLTVSLLLACGSENLIPPPHQDAADLYWDLELNHHAVVMSTQAPYDTLQLVATPRNFRDEPLPGLSGVTYTSTDPDRVFVTPDGLLTAVGRTSAPVEVIATLTTNHIRHSDTVVVGVVEDSAPPALATFSIHPVPPDSAKFGVSGDFGATDTLRPQVTSADGNSIPVYPLDDNGYLPVDFRSSDPTVALIGKNLPEIRGRRVGSTIIYASTTAFGTTKVDTLPYRIGWPAVAIDPVVVPIPVADNLVGTYDIPGRELWIGTGGVVIWASFVLLFNPPGMPDSISMDIVFADADLPNIDAMRPAFDLVNSWSSSGPFVANVACRADCDAGGNVLLTKAAPFAARRFTAPGTYEFHSEKAGVSGRIVVVDER